MAINLFAQKVEEKIKSALCSLSRPTLFILNERNLDILDYGFAQIAFAEIFGEKRNDLLFVATMVDSYDEQELFSGIIHIHAFTNIDNLSDKELLIKNGINHTW